MKRKEGQNTSLLWWNKDGMLWRSFGITKNKAEVMPILQVFAFEIHNETIKSRVNKYRQVLVSFCNSMCIYEDVVLLKNLIN